VTTLSITLFGSFQAALDGQPVTRFESSKVRALLAYLAVEADRPHSRDELIGLLWPDQPDSTARTNLRQALANLRLALDDRETTTVFISHTSDGIQFQPTSDHAIDVMIFSGLLSECKAHSHRRIESCQSCVHRLHQALELYRGDFLAHFLQSGSEAFEEWVLARREHWQQAALEALYDLAQHHELRGDYEQALRYARRQLALNAWREEAHWQVMRALALSGQRSAALAQFETCRRLLKEELSAEPARETTALLEKIKSGDLASDQRRHNLPAALTPLIGRERELTEINQLLENPACRLLTLTGQGGIGKTRLALQAASDHVGLFADGVWLIELAACSDPTLVPQAIASAIELREQSTRPLLDMLIGCLKRREVLLVLDNCEHLVDVCARLANVLLRECPQLSILATSREALNVAGEVAFHVPPLTTPDPQQVSAHVALIQYDAVRLFVERARIILSDFTVTNNNRQAVAQICYQLDGMPLAIELAAACVKVLSVDQIAARLNDRLSLLTNGYRTTVARHQTLRATLDWSYDLLSPVERLMLNRLSVFSGGWTLQAGEALTGVDGIEPRAVVNGLSRLVDKSLVIVSQQQDEKRFVMLETIRQYAWERLLESDEIDEARTRHLEFFLTLVQEKSFLKTDFILLNQLATEYPNLREALEWSLSSGQVEAGLQLASALCDFWHIRGQVSEGRTWLKRALAMAGDASVFSRGMALFDLGGLEWFQGNFAVARSNYEESLQLWQELGNTGKMAMALRKIGDVDASEGKYAEAHLCFEQSLAICRELKYRFGMMRVFTSLGELARAQDDYTQAEIFYRESLALADELNSSWHRDLLLDNLACVAQHKGEYLPAQMHYQKMLVFSQKARSDMDCAGYLAGLAGVAGALGNLVRAVRLFAAVKCQLAFLGVRLDYADHAEYERNLAAVRIQMEDDEFENVWAEGRAMTLEQAIEYALASDDNADWARSRDEMSA
jgi:predicted ATPase/DNA-binding SARP family transcriptional activator